MLLAVLLMLLAVLAWKLVDNLRTQQTLVQDRAEIRHVRYGILNVDKWVEQVSVIVEKKVRDLEIRGAQREAMKRALERILDTLITEADRYIHLQHTTGNWWDRTTGRLKEGMRNTVMDIDTVKAGIPAYAEQILNELEKRQTRQEINTFLMGIIGDISRSTFGEVDETRRVQIHQLYQCATTAQCNTRIISELTLRKQQSRYMAALILLGCLLLLLQAPRVADASNRLPWAILSCSATLLLLCGVLTPMIEVEAQITNLHFVLMGYPVEFFDEVLYFQSKSIFEVVSILVETREVDMILVGVLLVTFSVIFPFLKLLASLLIVYNPAELGRSASVEFFALKSGKWSMADVMVIAIFMAYIGFNGMISNQMDLISQGAASAGVEVLTTNGTTLQMGFFMFLAFCLFNLLVSTTMESTIDHNKYL